MKISVIGCVLLALSNINPALGGGLIDFGEPNAASLWQQFRDLEAGKFRQPLRIMQIGDSHTAGDYFTGQLRNRLQSRYGNAGVGWIPPGNITNQRSAAFRLSSKGKWNLLDSKIPSQNGTFPLGGLVNITQSNAMAEFTAKDPIKDGHWFLHIWLQGKQPWRLRLSDGSLTHLSPKRDKFTPWSLLTVETHASALAAFSLEGPALSALGGLFLDRDSPGITLDAMGINGAKGNVIGRWDGATLRKQMQWRRPKLIILAYGTNEAFDLKFDAIEFAQTLRDNIRSLRFLAPGAALLVIGAPASAKNSPPNLTTSCPQGIAKGLPHVVSVQKRVAQEEKTLYWDWAGFMGGICGAPHWAQLSPPKMGKDLIHLSKEGYEGSADDLFGALQNEIRP
jgi:lysophospholipase L1-like esterase